MARILASILTLACLLWAPAAGADAASRLGVEIVESVSGSKMPGISVKPKEDVKRLRITLVRSDKRKLRLSAANIRAGTKKVLPVKQEPGQVSYTGEFDVDWADGDSSEFKMRFTLTRARKLQIDIKPQNVDLGKRIIKFSINNRAKKAELVIYGQKRKPIKRVTKQYGGARAGKLLELSWGDPGGDVLYMDLKVYDTSGFWKGVRLTPFSISIPHDDVVFDTGKWKIKESEEPKLEDTMKQIREALAEHGTLLTLKLYIAGYTDTVGSKASNERLSRNRARSIAAWFRKNGLKIPIFYQGFGERVLAKETPDDTPEEANRRALYILSSQMPPKSGQLPDQNWRRL